MGKNTFVFTLNETKESNSVTINIEKVEFTSGVWTKDKLGRQKLKEAVLGNIVFFHINTKGIADGEEITLKLYEQDKNLFLDWVDPDDEKFPEEEVVKKVKVKENKAYVKLLLQENWDVMIKDDSDNAFSLDQKLELYWEVSYGGISTELPIDDDKYLRVGHNDRTLYFKTPIISHNLPEFVSNDGSPMLLMQFAKDFAEERIKDKVLGALEDKADDLIQKIAFVKLKKGYMVDNFGKVYKGDRLIREYKKIYTNSGEVFHDVEMGKNFGYKYGGQPLRTTKGISQYDYFSKNGSRVTLLGMVKSVGNVLDVFNLLKVATEDLDMSKPLPLDFGPLSPLADLAGILVQEQKAEMDMWLEEEIQKEIDIAKLEGLEATRKVINTWNHNNEYNWQLLPISREVANRLLKGEFTTFSQLDDSNFESMGEKNVNILYRVVNSPTKENTDLYIIETIFIDE